LRILAEYEAAPNGEKGAVLRRPERSRSSTPADSVSTERYHDPKIVKVAVPTNTVNTTRPPACRSARSMAPTRPYVVILSGGQHSVDALTLTR
jgi:hypothetical protein